MGGGEIKVRLVPEGVEKVVEAGRPLKAGELLRILGMNEEVAVVLRDGKPLLPEDLVSPGESVEVVRVLSGG
ncbi:sulfur transfer protein [Aeropyrum camini]|uniref:Sulfur transfer protein n=1 Tax=Aeropyrum camini SY1 = JCM 12091 TaxID=1198449 RepID=U3TFF9_9CREN|nr:sulfur transfer protein [Aeropyrum camini]BAN90775.1 sulfur transfer protein [Aeropyrum camini SY1 = JCM 12091]